MSMAISGMGSAMQMQAMSGASMRMPPAQKMSNLFAQIDTANTGNITKSQFSQAFNTLNPPAGFKAIGADNVFARLDTNNNGSVSKQEFVNGMTQLMAQIRQHQHAAPVNAPTATDTINASLSALGSNINTSA